MDIKGIFKQATDWVKKLGKKTRQMIILGIAAVIVLSVLIAVIVNNRPYETLFANLTASEASEIMGKLDEMGVEYQYENNGTILVPKNQEPQVKAQLVSQGYPKSGLTYDVFTANIGMMTTDFERQSYLIFDLQDRIAATIRHFAGVSDAIVNIVVGEEQKYVLQQSATETKASVTVIMQNGGSPGADVVEGIVRLVVNSVPGTINEQNVTVLDGNGRVVNSTTGASSQYGMAALKLSLEREIDQTLANELLYMLSPLYGEGKVRVSVNSTVDVDKKIREYIEYLPYENGRGIIARESHYADVTRSTDEDGGVPGTESNAEVPVYAGVTLEGDEIYFQTQDDIDYVVSQIKEQVQSEAGAITGIMVSIAIDDIQPTGGRLNELRALVARTAGIADEDANASIAFYFGNFATVMDEGPGEIVNGGLPRFMWYAIGVGAALLLVLILVLVVAARRRRKKRNYGREAEEYLDEEAAAFPPENYIMDIKLPDIKKTREQELKNQIIDFADKNPEISAQLIKTWLKGVEAQ